MDRKQELAYLTAYLKTLANTPSPSGFTHMAADFLMQTLTEMGFSPYQSFKGAVLCKIHDGTQSNGILLSAHIDTLGLMVRSVKANGRLRFTKVGGFPLQYVEQENVVIHTREGKCYSGTVRMNEPAVHGRQDLETSERSDSTMEIVIDEKTSSREETEKLGITAGDFVSLDPRFVHTESGFIKSRHMDDKAASAVLLSIAKAFSEKRLSCTRPVYIMFTNYEEVGHGAAAAHPLCITDMIAVDMGVVADDLKTDEHCVSICPKDSSGPYNYALTNELIKAAKDNHIPYALDIYPYYGSDASCAMRAGYDYRHALIGPGVAASHGYERVHEDGLYATLCLLKEYLKAQV